MKKNYSNKMATPDMDKMERSRYYPDLGVTVMAATKQEADKKALALNKKNANAGKRNTTGTK